MEVQLDKAYRLDLHASQVTPLLLYVQWLYSSPLEARFLHSVISKPFFHIAYVSPEPFTHPLMGTIFFHAQVETQDPSILL